MQNKAPQGKPDPIPTPEQELEKYGVWVKAEPQDILDDSDSQRETIYPMDETMDIDGSDAILLSEDDEELLDSFDLPEEVDEAAIVEEDDDIFEDLESLSPLEPESLVEMSEDTDDFNFESLDSLEEESPVEHESQIETGSIDLDEDVIEDSIIDIELDELDYEEPVSEARVAQRLTSEHNASSSKDESFATTEINIEDFGIGDEVTSDFSPSLESIGSEYASVLSPDGSEISSMPSEEFEPLDIDLQFDDTIPDVETHENADMYMRDDDELLDIGSEFESVDIDSIGIEDPVAAVPSPKPEISEKKVSSDSFEESSLDSFIDDDDSHEPGIMPEMSMENVTISDDDIGFDDIKAVSDDLSNGESVPSSSLLEKIALELSSIKEELVSLRSQLGKLKATEASGSGDEPDEDSFEESQASGFFDDEDDDTIALTGDELDNILNTADFTEEAVEESLNEEEPPQMELPDDIELLPEDGNYEHASEPGIELIDLPMVEQSDEDIKVIDASEGVIPLTTEPEDTHFLDTANDDELLELDSMEFEDIPLVEPEASDIAIMEDSTFGDELDDETLPVLEDVSDDFYPEITLDLDAEDKPVVSTVDSFPDAITEIEEAAELEELYEPDDLGGLELLSEESDLELQEDSGTKELDESSLDSIDSLDSVNDIGDSIDAISPPSKPVNYHPDTLSTSLDDSLFVDSDIDDEISVPDNLVEPIDDSVFEELSPLDEIVEPMEDLQEEEISSSDDKGFAPVPKMTPAMENDGSVPDKLKRDVKSVLLYLDQLLASLPEEKIEEFASSEYYDTYKHLFDDLGLL